MPISDAQKAALDRLKARPKFAALPPERKREAARRLLADMAVESAPPVEGAPSDVTTAPPSGAATAAGAPALPQAALARAAGQQGMNALRAIKEVAVDTGAGLAGLGNLAGIVPDDVLARVRQMQTDQEQTGDRAAIDRQKVGTTLAAGMALPAARAASVLGRVVQSAGLGAAGGAGGAIMSGAEPREVGVAAGLGAVLGPAMQSVFEAVPNAKAFFARRIQAKTKAGTDAARVREAFAKAQVKPTAAQASTDVTLQRQEAFAKTQAPEPFLRARNTQLDTLRTKLAGTVDRLGGAAPQKDRGMAIVGAYRTAVSKRFDELGTQWKNTTKPLESTFKGKRINVDKAVEQLDEMIAEQYNPSYPSPLEGQLRSWKAKLTKQPTKEIPKNPYALGTPDAPSMGSQQPVSDAGTPAPKGAEKARALAAPMEEAYRGLVQDSRDPNVLISDLLRKSGLSLDEAHKRIREKLLKHEWIPGLGEPTVATDEQLAAAFHIDDKPYLYVRSAGNPDDVVAQAVTDTPHTAPAQVAQEPVSDASSSQQATPVSGTRAYTLTQVNGMLSELSSKLRKSDPSAKHTTFAGLSDKPYERRAARQLINALLDDVDVATQKLDPESVGLLRQARVGYAKGMDDLRDMQGMALAKFVDKPGTVSKAGVGAENILSKFMGLTESEMEHSLGILRESSPKLANELRAGFLADALAGAAVQETAFHAGTKFSPQELLKATKHPAFAKLFPESNARSSFRSTLQVLDHLAEDAPQLEASNFATQAGSAGGSAVSMAMGTNASLLFVAKYWIQYGTPGFAAKIMADPHGPAAMKIIGDSMKAGPVRKTTPKLAWALGVVTGHISDAGTPASDAEGENQE